MGSQGFYNLDRILICMVICFVSNIENVRRILFVDHRWWWGCSNEKYYSVLMTRIVDFIAWLLFLLMLVVPQSFATIKAPMLFVVLLYVVSYLALGRLKLYSPEVINYYFLLAFLSLFWVLIGAVNDSDVRALSDAFRLYVVFSVIYVLLIIYVSNRDFYNIVIPVITLSAILIALISFYTVIDAAYNFESIPLFIKEEMYLQAGIHSGYTQLNNINIGMYCFLIPFLFSFFIMNKGKANLITLFALLLSILAVFIASRRMVIFLVVLAPFLCVIVDLFITARLNVALLVKVLIIYLVMAISVLVMLSINYYFNLFDTAGVIDRISDALIFDAESARETQFLSLIDGFYKNPIIGSGFGGETAVTRSVERPWNYELTYSKLLFNAGIIGVLLIFSLFFYYICMAFKMLRINNKQHSINASLMVGFFSVLIASASNPYLGSFDFLFVLSIPPLIISLIKKERRIGPSVYL